MSPEGWIALSTLVGATLLFLSGRVSITLTALAIPVVLYITGTLPEAVEAFSGFSSNAAIAIGAVFVLGAGLKEASVATLMARGLQRLGAQGERSAMALLMLCAAGLSAFMSNAAVVAMLLPVAMALSRAALIPPSRLLMPMAFAAVLGGTITLMGTAPNILVGEESARFGEAFHVFEFSPVGIPVTLAGIALMVLLGPRILPAVLTENRIREARLPEEVAVNYGLPEQLFKMRVAEVSRLAGKTIREAELRNRYDLEIVMVKRPTPLGVRWIHPAPDVRLQPGDLVLVQGDAVRAWDLAETELLQFGLPGPRVIEKVLGRGVALAEVTVPPHSRAIGQSFRELDFRRRFGLSVLAIWRGDRTILEDVPETPLAMGDAFLVSGPAEKVHKLEHDPDFILLTDLTTCEDVGRAPLAILILLLAVIPAVALGTPFSVSALGAAILMVATGCVSAPAVRRAIDWKVLALIAGTLPLGLALEHHGVADLAAQGIQAAGAPLGAAGMLALLFLSSALLAVLASNAAAAVIMVPVAGALAQALPDLATEPALLSVAFGCSCAFVLPFAQCNVLVMGPGGYRSRDYLRLGIWVSLIMFLLTLALLSPIAHP